MFDTIDYDLIIKYIDDELIPYINYYSNTQSGGANSNLGTFFYREPSKVIKLTVESVAQLTSITFGKQEGWFNIHVKPLLLEIEPFISRILGYNDSKIISYILIVKILINILLSHIDYIFFGYKKLGSLVDDNDFELSDEKITEIKDLLNSILNFLNILLVVIISINVIKPNLVKDIEKMANQKYKKIKIATNLCYKSLKQTILGLIFTQPQKKKTYKLIIDDGDDDKADEAHGKKETFMIAHLVLDGGSNDQTIISKSVDIIKQYNQGVSIGKLISDLYSSFNFPSKNTSTKVPVKFFFDKLTGTLKTNIPENKTIWLGSDRKIKLVLKSWDIKYFLDDNIEINTFSYFNGIPIHSFLIHMWIRSKSESVKLTFPTKPKFRSLNILDLTQPLTVSLCKLFGDIFKDNKNLETKCLQLAHAIISNSPEYMLQILADKQLNQTNLLKSSNKKIHYQILKTLGFKKNFQGQICSYDEWIQLNNPTIVQTYSKYLNRNVKNIINKMLYSFPAMQLLSN
jgi:hypothetical protein